MDIVDLFILTCLCVYWDGSLVYKGLIWCLIVPFTQVEVGFP